MNFYSCLDLPRAEARIHEKKSNYLKAILENHQNRSMINRRRAADLPYYPMIKGKKVYKTKKRHPLITKCKIK